MSTVGSEFPVEQERVRRLIETYRSLPNGAGGPGAIILDAVLSRAAAAQASGDVIEILRSFEELRGCE